MWWKYITYHCNILALLSIVFVPNANHYVPTAQVIFIFAFRAYLYAFFSCGFVIFQIATNPFEHIVLLIQDLYISYLIILVEFL